MRKKLKSMRASLGRRSDVGAFVLTENIHRLRIIAIGGGLVNIAVSLFSIQSSYYSKLFFEQEIYLRCLWILLSVFYVVVSSQKYVDKHLKYVQLITYMVAILSLVLAALVSGMPFADQSYLIVYYANLLFTGTLLYLSFYEIIMVTFPSLVVIGSFYVIYPAGTYRFESNIVNVLVLAFFTFLLATMNYKLKSQQYDALEQVKRQNETLQWISNRDELTDMPNRRKINETLETELRAFQEGGKPLGILMIDIDYFKYYNDTYGHLIGDDCLMRVATALKAFAQSHHGFIGRFGGEEFLLILPLTGTQSLKDNADRLRMTIEDLNIEHTGSSMGKVTISIGAVAMETQDRKVAFQSRELLEVADKALYKAKENGRNGSVVVDI